MSKAGSSIESVLLLAAFACLLPYIPPFEGYEYRFGFMEVIAISLVGFSRGLRWRKRGIYTVVETGAFAVFVWLLVRSLDLIHIE